MKTLSQLRSFVFGTSLMLVSPAFAEAPKTPPPAAKPQAKPQPKPKPKPKAQTPPAGLGEVLKKYDLDHNKFLSLTEAQTMQTAFKDNPQDPLLKKYDADKNAELSDAEIMKIIPAKPVPPKPKPKPKQKKPAPKKPNPGKKK